MVINCNISSHSYWNRHMKSLLNLSLMYVLLIKENPCNQNTDLSLSRFFCRPWCQSESLSSTTLTLLTLTYASSFSCFCFRAEVLSGQQFILCPSFLMCYSKISLKKHDVHHDYQLLHEIFSLFSLETKSGYFIL